MNEPWGIIGRILGIITGMILAYIVMVKMGYAQVIIERLM